MSQPEGPTPVPQPALPDGLPVARTHAEEALSFPLAGFPARSSVAEPALAPPPPGPPPSPPSMPSLSIPAVPPPSPSAEAPSVPILVRPSPTAAPPPSPRAMPAAADSYAVQRVSRSEFVPSMEAFDQPPRRRAPLLPIAIAVAAVVVVAGLAWLLWPSPSTPAASDTSGATAPAPARAEDAARLDSLLPAGYPSGVCQPVDVPAGALAKVRCGRNSETDGPDSATYTLAADVDSLRALFEAATHDGVVVVCPGNIQSPGPWRRNSAPGKEAGVLVCGLPGNTPTVAWTDNDHLLLSVTQSSGAPSATLTKLYNWWSLHS